MGVCICICITVIIVSLIFAYCYYQEHNSALSFDVEMDLRKELKTCQTVLNDLSDRVKELER